MAKESVPAAKGTVVSKVISQSEMEGYMSGLFCSVWGYITQANDTAMCRNYMDFYLDLGLGYEGSTFDPQKDEYLGIIRFRIRDEDDVKLIIPYGKALGGIFDNPRPFTGNGYAIGAGTGSVIPEYMLVSPFALPDGAELYILTKEGEEIFWAIFTEEKGRFVRLEDMN